MVAPYKAACWQRNPRSWLIEVVKSNQGGGVTNAPPAANATPARNAATDNIMRKCLFFRVIILLIACL